MKNRRGVAYGLKNAIAKVAVISSTGLMYRWAEERQFEHAPRPFDIAEHGHHPMPYVIASYLTAQQLEAHTSMGMRKSILCSIGAYSLIATLYETPINPIPNTRDWLDIVYSLLGIGLGAAVVTPYRPLDLSLPAFCPGLDTQKETKK